VSLSITVRQVADVRFAGPIGRIGHTARRLTGALAAVGDRQRDGRNHQLNQPPDLLNHAQAIRRLYSRPFQPIVKHRVFVRDQVQLSIRSSGC
jgi:hypothetical protein